MVENPPGFVDSHDVVVRVNNYKLGPEAGHRTDIHFSFYGASIRKSAAELKRDGVKLCWCKCPDAKFIESEWHRVNRKPNGVDFRYIYKDRRAFWFGPTYVPTREVMLGYFNMLGQRMPTTGFQALMEILASKPRHIYMTGFDFFGTGVHNVNERWRPGNPNDPIGHAPEVERQWLIDHIKELPMTTDPMLSTVIAGNYQPKCPESAKPIDPPRARMSKQRRLRLQRIGRMRK